MVAAVAKRPIRRMSAATQGHERLIGRQHEGISLMIDKLDAGGNFEHERTVLAGSNDDVGHGRDS